MYDEVYKDSQGRETPSVKVNVKNGNYRRKDMVGISFITSAFNFSTRLSVGISALQMYVSLSSTLITKVSPDFNFIHRKYAKM